MGRKGSWFSAIKRVFVPSSKGKSTDGQDKKTTKEKKGRGALRAGASESLEPQKPKTFLSFRLTSPRLETASPLHASSMYSLPRVASQKVSTPRTTYQKVAPPKGTTSPRITHNHKQVSFRPEPTSTDLQISATKIQAAYRGYLARRCFIALRGLVRLERVVRGENVKRQTVDALNQMQLLVRLQTQIHSRRILRMEKQALQHQAHKNDTEVETTLSKWKYNQLVHGNNEEWDTRVLKRAMPNWERGLVPWPSLNKYPRPRTSTTYRFDVANYMQPTVSSKAKVRANIANRGKHQSLQSIDDQVSMCSAVSMPVVGRKPFNRFV
ncbi:hypothetical protein Leryth_009646 [Lithospermum erythrorhizon]|nr:hypothetical protein Leryth_009646 [Lithospermum erythrorhizon]